MDEYVKKILTQISEFVTKLSPAKKMAMAVTGFAVAFGMSGLFYWAGEKTFTPLMTKLNPEDSANIIRILREKHISFKVDPAGKNISIPPESLYELRLELATMGLPQSSVVGYEIFDKQSFGTTSFVQKVNQKRALEGELMRTISTIRGVKRARVHLATPQKSTFVEDQKKSTASVVLDLDPGVQLVEKQVFGIGNLIARAVEGMDPSDVVVMDSNGKVLSKNPTDALSAATASQLDYQQKVESDFEKRIESILSRVVGDGRVVAKVTADLEFSQVNETQTTYDADGTAIRSVDKRNDSMNMVRPGPYGVTGQVANNPGQPPAPNGDVKNDTVKNNEVVNYEVPQTVRRTTRPQGSIKRISVAVVVDGKTVKTVGKDGVMQSKIEAWGPLKIKEFEDIVASAVGIDRKRGDSLEIRNMDFAHEDFEEATRAIAEKERRGYVMNMVIYGLIGLIIVMFFMFVVKPFIRWITENTIDSVDTFLPQTIEELEKLQKTSNIPILEDQMPVIPEKVDPEKVEGEMLKEKITTLVDANPHKAALILRDWLHAEKKKKEEEGKGKSATA